MSVIFSIELFVCSFFFFVFDIPHFDFALPPLSERGIDFAFDGIAPEWFVFTSYGTINHPDTERSRSAVVIS